MKNKSKIKLFLISIPLSMFCLVLNSGCSQSESEASADDNSLRKHVYVCSKTEDIFAGGPLDVPALNPQTGKKTLQHGMYCQDCETWHSVPPLELTGGNQGFIRCPASDIALVLDGPIPEDARILDVDKNSEGPEN